MKKLGEPRALRFPVIGAPVVVLVQGFVYGDDLFGLFLDGLFNFDLGVKRAKLAKARVELQVQPAFALSLAKGPAERIDCVATPRVTLECCLVLPAVAFSNRLRWPLTVLS